MKLMVSLICCRSVILGTHWRGPLVMLASCELDLEYTGKIQEAVKLINGFSLFQFSG